MKTFTNCAEKKAKQFLNLLQGYTRGIRMTAILVLLLMGVSNAWGKTIYLHTPSDGWAKDGAKIAIYWWNNSSNGWSNYMVNRGFDIYSTTIDDNATDMIIVRFNKDKNGTKPANWEQEWNRAEFNNIGDKNFIKIGVFKNDGSFDKELFESKHYETYNHNKKIYFDNTTTQWENIHLRIGRDDNCSEFKFIEKVKGTQSLYVMNIPEYVGYSQFYFANSPGWTVANKIDQPYLDNSTVKPDDNFEITERTTYFTGNLEENILFVPTTIYQNKENCDYYYVDIIENQQPHTQTVTFSQHTAGGTVVISYIDENGDEQNVSDGSFTVAQTCILKVESANPNKGYKFNQVSFYDGTNYHTKAIGETFIVRAGTTIYPEFVTSETNKVYFKLSGDAYTHWTAAESRIAVYAWYNEHILGESPSMWIEMEKVPNKDNLYRCEIPDGYKRFSFVRLCPSGHQDYNSTNNGFNWDNKWNQSLDQEFTQVIAGKNCLNLTTKTEDNAQNEKYTGDWIASKVYLDPNAYCTYGITCNDKDTYLNHATEERMIELPYGSKLKIVDAHNISPYYKPNPRYSTSVVINRAFETSTNSSLTLYDEIRYSANVVTKETQRVYLHLPSSLKNEWIKGTTGNDWFNCIYLRDYLSHGRTLDPEHNNGSNIEYGKVVKGFSHESFDANEDEYWYIDIPAGFNAFGFERKNSTGQGTGFANRTIEFEYEIPLDGVDNCFTINSTKVDGRYTGSWGPLPKCTVELGYCEFGTHGIKYKGQEYFANHNETTNTKVIVSYGDEVEVLPGQPMRSDAYTNHAEQKIKTDPNKSNYDKSIKIFDKFDGVENKVTITENTLFDDYYLTKEPHDVYIGIPNTGMDNIWYQQIPDESNNNALVDGDIYIWPLANNAGKDLVEKIEMFENEGVTYYKFTLPAGINAFYFQRKAYNGSGTTYCQSVKLLYEIPLNEENCYMLDKGKTPNSYYTGYWKSMPAHEDFRLLYVEQEVIKAEDTDGDKWLTKVNRTYEHQSDIIKKRNNEGSDVVSLHIYTRGDNPEIILQQYDEKERKWVDIEAHMVNGPLEATPGMGMLPGRKNASPGSDIDDFVYDDGIEKIKNDPTDDGCGVWDFKVIQDGKSATLDLINGLERYTGKYYIRTANAEGKWIDYTIPANHMTFSPYAKQHHGEYFSHYFCKWVDLDKHYNDVSFIIANDHAKSLTDPSYLFDDKYVNNQWLPENANIRWGWSIINNKVSRAYIAGSYNGDNEFLVVKRQDNDNKVKLQENINGKMGYFNDNTNWLYYADLEAQPEAQVQVKAKYNDKYQYFMGKSDPDQYQKLIGGDYANDKRYYPIRILYDFKEHRFVVGYHPETQIDKDVAIETPVMLIREHHNAPNQITFDKDERTIEAPMPAYGVITFLEEKLIDPNISKNEKMFYWVSFPFDVRISHVFGLGEYGSHWVMEEYDGEARAEEGWNIYNTFWRYITDTATTLEAGKGYVLCLNYNRVINEAFLSAENEKISLYFPSIEEVDQSTIKNQGSKEIEIPTWTGRAPTKDHNWNLIGAISYANTGETTQQSNAKFLYEYQPDDDTYSPRASNGYTFNALHAYMVQYGGKITWDNFIAVVPQAIAAKRDAENDDNMHELSLDLILNGTTQDQTFIQLEDGEATQMFDLNIDMTKIINSGSNIYSISDDNNKLAGSVIPIEETIIPLGVVSAAAGEYTFAMPNGTDGIVVELIDYETNTRTNMLLDEYTINLGKGTFENRFALHVKPDKTTTSVDNIGNEATGDKVKKFLIDGVLYMQKDGVLYDAQGRKL